MPNLKSRDSKKPLAVPQDFITDVSQACSANNAGDLLLYLDEIKKISWALEGIRVIARCQFDLGLWEAAKSSWEDVFLLDNNDLDARLMLGALYRKLGQAEKSEEILRELTTDETVVVERQLEKIERRISEIGTQKKCKTEQVHYILFTGHRIDEPGRETPRFPAVIEKKVSESLTKEIKNILTRVEGKVAAIAGGASGGDIIFLENCHEQGIVTNMYLGLVPKDYISASVRVTNQPEWIERFRIAEAYSHVRVLHKHSKLPGWLGDRGNDYLWERTNIWMLKNALVNGGKNVTLIALWDGAEGDGSGGTQHMISLAKESGANIIMIDINQWL